MANEGSTKPTYSELERLLKSMKDALFKLQADRETRTGREQRLTSELARVRGLLQRQSEYPAIWVKRDFAPGYEQWWVMLDWPELRRLVPAMQTWNNDNRQIIERYCSGEKGRLLAEEHAQKLRRLFRPEFPTKEGTHEEAIAGSADAAGRNRASDSDSGGRNLQTSDGQEPAVSAPQIPATFPQSSSLEPQGAESVDIGKLDTVDKAEPLNQKCDACSGHGEISIQAGDAEWGEKCCARRLPSRRCEKCRHKTGHFKLCPHFRAESQSETLESGVEIGKVNKFDAVSTDEEAKQMLDARFAGKVNRVEEDVCTHCGWTYNYHRHGCPNFKFLTARKSGSAETGGREGRVRGGGYSEND